MPDDDPRESEPPLRASIVPVTPFQQNCSVVWCTTTMKGAVIDPGGDLDNILGAVEAAGIELERILVTHGHMDHAGAVAEMAERLELPVEGPEKEDRFVIDRIEESGARYGLAGARPFTPDRWLEDGDQVAFGEVVMDVYHCPGHTPGHVVFYHPPSDLAFVGDVLFQGSIGRTDFPRGDHATLIQSIRGKLWPLGDEVTFVPGHGPASTFGHERKTNPFCSDFVETD